MNLARKPDDVSLRDYVEAGIAATEQHLKELIDDQKELTEAKFVTYRTLLDSNAEKVALALSATQLAIDKEVQTTNERLKLLNELRTGVATKEELHALQQRYDDLKETLGELRDRFARMEAAELERQAAARRLVSLVALMATIVGVAVAAILGFNS